jgi:hypothetical protein
LRPAHAREFMKPILTNSWTWWFTLLIPSYTETRSTIVLGRLE